VERILIDKGAAAGVALTYGRELPARSVVSNASALTTFERMLPPQAVPADFLERLRGYRPSISTFIVWLGLNREIRDTVSAYSTHVATGRGAEADYRAAIEGDIEKVSFSVTVYDKLYPGYSTPGTSTVMLLCLSGYGPWERFASDYRVGRKSAYNEEKQRWAEILVRRATAEVIPGLPEMIEVREAATPLTNWRYTGNTHGAIYGFEQSMDNAYMNRIDNRTPVKGLYLTGAWGNPGGGFEGALRSGAKTFAMLLDDWRSG
jgi:prolycopene isomerase